MSVVFALYLFRELSKPTSGDIFENANRKLREDKKTNMDPEKGLLLLSSFWNKGNGLWRPKTPFLLPLPLHHLSLTPPSPKTMAGCRRTPPPSSPSVYTCLFNHVKVNFLAPAEKSFRYETAKQELAIHLHFLQAKELYTVVLIFHLREFQSVGSGGNYLWRQRLRGGSLLLLLAAKVAGFVPRREAAAAAAAAAAANPRITKAATVKTDRKKGKNCTKTSKRKGGGGGLKRAGKLAPSVAKKEERGDMQGFAVLY